MIERNLGNVERIFRLMAGIALLAWVVSSPYSNGVDIFVTIIAVALILNGVFSRCYLWYVLDINSHRAPADQCNE